MHSMFMHGIVFGEYIIVLEGPGAIMKFFYFMMYIPATKLIFKWGNNHFVIIYT